MMREPRWISKKALLLLHEESLAEFGGARGLADEALLDSALARPRNTHSYKPESTMAELAAAYAFGLAKNHAFVDGNKRVAFLSMGMFLAINGFRLKVDQLDAIHTMLGVAAGEVYEQGLAAWIATNSVPATETQKNKRGSRNSSGSKAIALPRNLNTLKK